MIFYQVIRHSGRHHSCPRTLTETDSRERAERIYRREAEKLRAGTVSLLADGLTVSSTWGPWLRTRW